MNKTWIVLRREYLTRVSKKSFIIMTILGPILFAALMIVPVVLALKGGSGDKLINVVDKSGYFADALTDNDDIKFRMVNQNPDTLKQQNKGDDDFYMLYIPAIDINNPEGVQLFAGTNPSLELKMTIEKKMEKKLRRLQLEKAGIDPSEVEKIKANISLNTYKLSEAGGEEASSSEAASIAGYLGGFLIYMFIFIYGTMIMRGVMEEKSNRIVEVIVSTVKPFHLMMGKVLGIALVGLSQLTIWILLTLTLTTVASSILGSQVGGQLGQVVEQQQKIADNPEQAMQLAVTSGEEATKPDKDSEKAAKVYGTIMTNLRAINLPLVLFSFVFYFIGGYFFYGALFAAVGGAVDSETETQQFMLPITIPLILAIIVGQVMIKDPHSTLAFWFSIIPFTSPITMMVRVPFGVPTWELALSMALLVAGFVGTIWLAGRIYRVGILMYGKKITFKELGKWLFYKE